MSKYLIIGGNSDIAFEFARILLKNNHEIVMSSKNYDKLLLNSKKLEVEFNVKIKKLHIDIENLNDFDNYIQDLDKDIQCIFFSCGYIEKKEINLNKIKNINYIGPKIFIDKILKTINIKKIIAITSIAAKRVDYKSKTYSYSKKLFNDYLYSLNKIKEFSDIEVKIILPGYVKTKMTKDLKIPSILSTTPKKLSLDIYGALNKNQKEIITPKYWVILVFLFNLLFFFRK